MKVSSDFLSGIPGNFPPKTTVVSKLHFHSPSIIWKKQNKHNVEEKLFEFYLEGPGVLQKGETITAGYITENHLITGSSFLFSPNTLPFLRLWDINDRNCVRIIPLKYQGTIRLDRFFGQSIFCCLWNI